jgi:hypothetical protein
MEVSSTSKEKASFEAKWPEDVAQRGFVPVPKCLITCAGELRISPQEQSALLVILEKCWFAGDVSWQKVDTIAASIGRSNSTTRAILTKVAKKRLMNKTQRYNTSNLYDLTALGQRLSEHMPNCIHLAKNKHSHSQKTSSLDSQKLSDYIEPLLLKTNNIKPNNIRRSIIKNNTNDTVSVINDIKQAQYKCRGNFGGQHEWREYSVDKHLINGDDAIYFYFICINCNMQFHAKDKSPWNAIYPEYHFDEADED